MSRYEHGRVLAVNETTLGSELVGAHAQGVSSLTVDDPVDFDEDGGWLSINGQVVEYSTYDDDTGEITLKGTLDAAAGEGDRVDLWDELRQVVTVDKIAQVELDGDDDNTDPLEATIPLHLLDDLAEGIRGIRGESVLLEQDGDEWRIVDVLGLAANGASGTQFWNDLHPVTATGQQTIALTHEPIDNSEHVYWNGLYQPASVWSRSGQTITVPDSGGHLLAGDELVVEYAYRVGITTLSGVLLPWQSPGWAYLQVASGDTVDRSAPGFDDSTWATAPAAFGSVVGQAHGYGYPAPATTWPVETRLWIRRTVAVPADVTAVTIEVRVDDTADVYWNGALVGSGTTADTGPTLLSFTPAAWAESNMLAIRASDGAAGAGNQTYLDAAVYAERGTA